MKKLILTTIPTIILTIITGILLLKITLGKIGNKENWRILAISLALIFFILFSIFLVNKIIKNNVA
jgi:uncharacterized membrane protein